nr:hypothetical protein [Luteitalea pratensis]
MLRSTELRIHSVQTDALQVFLREAAGAPIRVIANSPDAGDVAEYQQKLEEAEDSHHLVPDERVLFNEVQPGDASAFSDQLCVQGVYVGPHWVLRCVSPAVPNAIAALLLYIRDEIGTIPHAYFEGNPIAYLLKFLVVGEGHGTGHP